MFFQFLADLVLLLHLGFILFVVLGGLLLRHFPRLIWFHLPAAAWGTAIELGGWLCPLTPLENRFRALAGQLPYQESFIERYLMPLVYPTNLRQSDQFLLGAGCLVINGLVYLWVFQRRMRRRRK